jgi:Flp pilus assembly protein TadD
MSEKSAQFNKVLKSNVDKIVLVVLFALLAGIGYLWWQEQNKTLAAQAGERKPAKFENKLATDPAVTLIKNMSTNPNLASAPEIQKVAQFNMFDYKTVRDKQAVEAAAQQKLTQAKTLIQQNRSQDALPLLRQAVSEYPGNKEARDLLASMTTGTATTAPGTSATTVPI